jgi:L-fuconolactonase
MRIDAHQHFWSTARDDYGWLTPGSGRLWADYGPGELRPLLDAARIDATILVQAAPTEAETSYLLEIARQTPFVSGVVGWTDFAAPGAVTRIAALASDPLLVGLRPMVQDIADDDWLASPALSPAFEAMITHDLVFDALVLPRHLPRLIRVVDRHPRLRVVIDHAAKPAIAMQAFNPWADDLRRFASHENVMCKLSGLVTEAAAHWTLDDLRPVTERLLTVFGAERLIFGSDWPVCTLRATYSQWLAASEQLLAHLSVQQRAAIYGGNAGRMYLANRGRRLC